MSLQIASSSHWNEQPPPVHVLAHCEPDRHWMMQSPPAHEDSQVAPDSQRSVQCPPAHVGVQVPEVQVKAQPPPEQEGEHEPESPPEHAQPASAVAWVPQAGKFASTIAASPGVPPSCGWQSFWKPVESSTAAHWASSAAASAAWQFCWSWGTLQNSHTSPSCVQGSMSLDGERFPQATAVTVNEADATKKRRRPAITVVV